MKQMLDVKKFIIVLFLIALILIGYSYYLSTTRYVWQEIGPDNARIVRVITAEKTCPEVVVDGRSQLMSLRTGKSSDSPVISCELTVSNSAYSVSVGSTVLRAVPRAPQRILVIGDTGCRLKGEDIQNCDDPQAWPFAQIAKVASSMNPDLIIHVGDNLYRQEPCPTGDTACQGSPYGNFWKTWEADFFSPAKPLLSKAPWIIVRGNHETCSRAGFLWFGYMAPEKFTGKCEEYLPPYLISFDNISFLNVDSAQASDFAVKNDEVLMYKDFFSSLQTLPTNTWLLTHRPLWGVKAVAEEKEEEPTEQVPSDRKPYLLTYANSKKTMQPLVGFNHTLQKSITPQLLDSLQVVLSGHYHNFEALSFDKEVPPQLMVGNSGTKLEEEIKDSLTDLVIDGHTVRDSTYLHQFGFVMLEEYDRNEWTATLYDVSGKILTRCVVKHRTLLCG